MARLLTVSEENQAVRFAVVGQDMGLSFNKRNSGGKA